MNESGPSYTTWRDDFAAGYIGAGGKLDNAAASTKKRLKKRYDDKMSALAKIADPSARGGTNCQGVTKDVKYSKKTERSEVWLDSCDTNDLIVRWGGCSLAMGWVTGRLKGWYQAIPGMFGSICGQKALAITAAKSNSRFGAIKYYYTRVARVGGNGMVDGQLRITVTIYSQ